MFLKIRFGADFGAFQLHLGLVLSGAGFACIGLRCALKACTKVSGLKTAGAAGSAGLRSRGGFGGWAIGL